MSSKRFPGISIAQSGNRLNKRKLLDITNTQPDNGKKRKVSYYKNPVPGTLSLIPDFLLQKVVGEYLGAEAMQVLMALSKTSTLTFRPMVRSVSLKDLSCAFSFLAALPFLSGLRSLALENCQLGSKQVRMFAAVLRMEDLRLQRLHLVRNGMKANDLRSILSRLRCGGSNKSLRGMSFRGNPVGKEGVREITSALNVKSFPQLRYLDLQNIDTFSLDCAEIYELIQSANRHSTIKCLNILGLSGLLEGRAMRNDLKVLAREEQLIGIMVDDFIAHLKTEAGASEVANTALDSLLERKDSDELWDVFIDIKDDNGNALLEPFEIPLSTEDLEDYAETQASCPDYRTGFREGVVKSILDQGPEYTSVTEVAQWLLRKAEGRIEVYLRDHGALGVLCQLEEASESSPTYSQFGHILLGWTGKKRL